MDWTLAMALEAGVWGKAGWLALHSHSEGLLTLASVPQHLPSLPPKVLHSVCGVPSFWLSSCLCVSLSTLGCVCVCVCLRVYVFVPCSLLLGQGATSGSRLCLLQPQCLSLRERRCSRMPPHLGYRATAVLSVRSVCPLPVFTE